MLQRLDRDVQRAIQQYRVVFVEFARSDYREALAQFSAAVLERAVFVYLDCPFDLCWERNVARWRQERERGIDAHLTSREEMERTYRTDDGLALPQYFPRQAIVVDNSRQDLALLDRHVEQIVAALQS